MTAMAVSRCGDGSAAATATATAAATATAMERKQTFTATTTARATCRGSRTAGRGSTVGLLLLLCIALTGPFSCSACVIQGYDSGDCRDQAEYKADMEFCGEVVKYRACVPRENTLWPLHDVYNKDQWIRMRFNEIVQERIRHETNETLDDLGINELGEEGDVVERFFENPDCEQAYKNYFCWLNFPRCDDEDRSLIMCRSACENFFKACKYDSAMHRCGNPIFYGGEEPEVDDVLDEEGLPLYWRANWPGLPFRDNEFDEEDNEVAVCTPSLKNAAPSVAQHVSLLLAAVAMLLASFAAAM